MFVGPLGVGSGVARVTFIWLNFIFDFLDPPSPHTSLVLLWAPSAGFQVSVTRLETI